MAGLAVSYEDETRLRELASGIAKDIEDVDVLLKRVGFTQEDYDELCSTRMFRGMLDEAYSEWQGAGNTQKRVKLKAATNVELSLPHFFGAMTNPTEPLSARAKIFELMLRAGGVGNPEPVAVGGGNAFNLTIQLDGGREVRVLGGSNSESEVSEDEGGAMQQSTLLDDVPFQSLDD